MKKCVLKIKQTKSTPYSSHRKSFDCEQILCKTSNAMTLCHSGLSPSMNFTNNDRNISHSVICRNKNRKRISAQCISNEITLVKGLLFKCIILSIAHFLLCYKVCLSFHYFSKLHKPWWNKNQDKENKQKRYVMTFLSQTIIVFSVFTVQ